jgi:acetylornithine deacetylase/succinyl-diaminopimelate desuccinylase-like protein
VTFKVDRRTEPTFTNPDNEIITDVQSAATQILGKIPALNMRVGASDARVYRSAGVPTVVYGPTPYNMGGADEYVMVSELEAIMQVQAIASLRFLSRKI